MNNKEKQNIDFLHLPVPKITNIDQNEFKVPSQIKKNGKNMFEKYVETVLNDV